MKEIKISRRERLFFETIGWLLFPIVMIFFYSNFFERELFLNRKNLYRHLKENPDALVEREEARCWTFDNFNIRLRDKGDWSLHYADKGGCVISSFRAGIPDRYFYNRILNLLEEAATNKEKT